MWDMVDGVFFGGVFVFFVKSRSRFPGNLPLLRVCGGNSIWDMVANTFGLCCLPCIV